RSRKQGYSDYLTGLSQVLKGSSGDILRGLVAERFKVALVDEFQDTDPVQNSIFNTFFDRPEVLFYRIGDPKQSIYGFRGADIYAYLGAALADGQERATLDKNYRSTPQLLKAFNRIFSVPDPFLLDGIDYRKMVCGRPLKEQERLLVDGSEGAALHFWHLAGAGDRDLTAGAARYRLFSAVANSCAELLSLAQQPLLHGAVAKGWRAEIVGFADGSEPASRRPLRASDIAILTATNKEAVQMWQACQKCKVPAVVAAAENLWQTSEAQEVFLFLKAQLEPENDLVLSSALATSLMGFGAQFLAAVHDVGSEASPERIEYELWRQAFFAGRELWLKHGVMSLFAGFPDFSGASSNPDSGFDLRLNLARTPRGERGLTNFYHLQEILHQEEHEQRLGPKALLNWFHEHLTGAVSDVDEYELRLESDADALQIMTVHKSKGLEFPVVFAPFLWSKSFLTSGGRQPLTIFHKSVADTCGHGADSGCDSQSVNASSGSGVEFVRYLDLNPEIDEEHIHAARAESLAESLRLFYVALTRAKMRLYLAWPQLKNSGKTALMYLRKPPRTDSEKQQFIAHGGPSP
ncbi:UvrD-helicase domain-containing protein, partial [bacterium]|nr:UvrD-helicase domain-containing protein [bacterium]